MALHRALPFVVLVLSAPVATETLAHATATAPRADTPWAGDAWLIAATLVAGALYAIGGLRHAAAAPASPLPRRYAVAWWTGWTALAIALLSPLDDWGAQLFTAHMVQHEILMLVAAPLLVLGKPLALFAWALPLPWTRCMAGLFKAGNWKRWWGWLTLPAVAWALHAGVLWAWHAPPLFEAGLRDDVVHDLMHASFLATALLFWWALFRRRHRVDSVLYVFTTMLHTGVLGMLLAFAATPWYPFYAGTTAQWGLTPLEDQQLGGLVMWVPSGALLIVAGLLLAGAWLGRAPLASPHDTAGT